MGTSEETGDVAHAPAATRTRLDHYGKRRLFWTAGAVAVFLLVTVAVVLSSRQYAQSLLRRDEDMTSRPERAMRMPGDVNSLALSRDRLLVGGYFFSNALQLLDIKKGECSMMPIHGNATVADVAASPRDNILAVAARGVVAETALEVWDLDSRRFLKSIPIGEDLVTRILFHPTRPYVYCEYIPGGDRRIVGVDIGTGRVETVFGRDRHGTIRVDWRYSNVCLLATSPDGERIVLGTWMHAWVWNTRTATEEFSCPLRTKVACVCAAVSPDGRLLATGGDEVELWDFRSGKRIGELIPDPNGVERFLRFSPDGTFLVAGVQPGGDGPACLFVWRVADRSRLAVFACPTEMLAGMCFLSDRNTILSATSDGEVSVWNLDMLQGTPGPEGGKARK